MPSQRLASVEKDPDKVIALSQQIVEKYEEEQRSTTYAKGKKRKLERVLERLNGRNPSL
jgi:hypothetical protein